LTFSHHRLFKKLPKTFKFDIVLNHSAKAVPCGRVTRLRENWPFGLLFEDPGEFFLRKSEPKISIILDTFYLNIFITITRGFITWFNALLKM
jgi:hypothetical protein